MLYYSLYTVYILGFKRFLGLGVIILMCKKSTRTYKLQWRQRMHWGSSAVINKISGVILHVDSYHLQWHQASDLFCSKVKLVLEMLRFSCRCVVTGVLSVPAAYLSAFLKTYMWHTNPVCNHKSKMALKIWTQCSSCVHLRVNYGALYKSDNNIYYRCCVYLWYSNVYLILWNRVPLGETLPSGVCWYCTGSDLCFATPPLRLQVDIF